MEINLQTLDLTKICRVCLCENSEMFSIFSELLGEENFDNEIKSVYELIMNISSMKIKLDDGLPQLICGKCIESLHVSYKFLNTCNNSQLILENYLTETLSQCNLIEETQEELIINEENSLDNDNNSLDLIENDLDLAENYIKESLIQEAQKNDVVLNPDEFFATTDECLNLPQIDVSVDVSTTEEINEIIDQESPQKKLPTDEKFFECKLCEKVYKSSSSLRAHIRGHHKNKESYKCDECGKGFKIYSSYFYHKRAHNGEQPYACKICGKKYKQSGTLTAHMRTHTGQKPFLCSICGRGFRQKPDLNYHMRSHTKEKPYQCAICGKTMSMQSHLVQHMRIHTGERPFKCNYCDKTFPTSTCLKRHEITHTDEKPYTCEICNKSFNRSSSLNVHAKIHKDERTHLCPICNKGFIQAYTLKSHILSHNAK